MSKKKRKVNVIRMPRYVITVSRGAGDTVVVYEKLPPPADANQMKLF
ncbi:MAG: hypothetical protein LBH25_04700 [Fibromonadaceae bacterium]|nr:hypothetical protein [Fibromonadaceae bacterium]